MLPHSRSKALHGTTELPPYLFADSVVTRKVRIENNNIPTVRSYALPNLTADHVLLESMTFATVEPQFACGCNASTKFEFLVSTGL